jgi:hypothetical protein
VQNDSAVFDVTKTIKERFRGGEDGEIMISLDITPKPADQPDHCSYQVSIKDGQIVKYFLALAQLPDGILPPFPIEA